MPASVAGSPQDDQRAQALREMCDRDRKILLAAVYHAQRRVHFGTSARRVSVPADAGGQWLGHAPSGDQLEARALFANCIEAADQRGSQRPDEVRYEPLPRVSLSRMEYIDIHFCHQKVHGVCMGPILRQRLCNPSYSVQELADRWLGLMVVMPSTVPTSVTEGSTSDMATAFLTTPDPETFGIAAESIT